MTRAADLTWPRAESLRDRTLVVPVGSTEQHGPHLPLSTDTDIAVHLAEQLAARRRDVVVAPALPYGASGEHAGFAGTLSIGCQALELLLVELVRSATDSFAHVLLLNGHGGNTRTVRTAVERLRGEGRSVRSWHPSWPGDAHAGRTETSVLLAIDARRVGPLRQAGATANLRRLMPQLMRDGVRAVTANGVLGDPAGATPAEGERLLAQALDDLDRAVAAWLQLEPA